jgi:hypothetical protein
VNYLTYLSELTDLKQKALDPAEYLQDFDTTVSNYRNAGGLMKYDLITLYLLKGLDPWYAPFSGPRTTLMRTSTLDKDFFNATRNGILMHFADTPKPLGYRAMGANGPVKHCQICEDAGKSERAIGSHNISEHRDFPPKGDNDKSNKKDKHYHKNSIKNTLNNKYQKDNTENTNYTANTATQKSHPNTNGPVYDTAANSHFFRT